MEYINIDDSNSETILELFSKSIDSEGFIIEKKTGKKIKCPYTNEYIKSNDFSIIPGTATFVKNKSFCFAEHRATHK